ncbi:hypothetical protein JOQ06_007248 [Pogonophryne albipinna]|uniref:Uncharacterized protein n=1 Tax=Pogonophryne albipinna TaxID=1090488 RepID=A0AAD6B0P1_9TELE|nr:hypothetical protein JOQ06_007248 [Pogonophryne albipinna]
MLLRVNAFAALSRKQLRRDFASDERLGGRAISIPGKGYLLVNLLGVSGPSPVRGSRGLDLKCRRDMLDIQHQLQKLKDERRQRWSEPLLVQDRDGCVQEVMEVQTVLHHYPFLQMDTHLLHT